MKKERLKQEKREWRRQKALSEQKQDFEESLKVNKFLS